MALGDAIRVRILCCLTFLVKVKSKVSALPSILPHPHFLPSSHSWGFLTISGYLMYLS